jgi:hypothetical protein
VPEARIRVPSKNSLAITADTVISNAPPREQVVRRSTT